MLKVIGIMKKNICYQKFERVNVSFYLWLFLFVSLILSNH